MLIIVLEIVQEAQSGVAFTIIHHDRSGMPGELQLV